MQISKVLFGLTVALLVTATCIAQDAEKKQDVKTKKATERAIKTTTNQMMKTFAKANLSEEQIGKAKAIIEKSIGGLMEAEKALDGLLNDEQKQSRTEAMAKAKEEGTKGNKLRAIGTEALGLTKEKMKEYNAAKKKVTQTTAKIKAAITDLLTAEQKALMPKRGNRKAKKKADADQDDGVKAGSGKDGADKDGADKGAEKTQTVSLKLPGMICEGCAVSVRSALVSVDGVADITTSVADNSCSFSAPTSLDVKAILDKFAADGNHQIKGWSLKKGPAF